MVIGQWKCLGLPGNIKWKENPLSFLLAADWSVGVMAGASVAVLDCEVETMY
jgi:hypothetical protein